MIQDWIEDDDWSRIKEYIKEDSLHTKQLVDVFLRSDANIKLDRVKQFVKLVSREYDVVELVLYTEDFFLNAIDLNRMDVIKYLIRLQDTIDHEMIKVLLVAGARFARLVPNDQIEQCLRVDDDDESEPLIEYYDNNDKPDLSGLLYAVYVCSDVYLKSIYMNHYNKLLLRQKE